MGTIVDAEKRFATPERRVREERARASLAARIHEVLSTLTETEHISTQYLTRFTVSFRTVRGLTGRVQVEASNRFVLNYRLAGLGNTLEIVAFGSYDEAIQFLSKIARGGRRAPAASESAQDEKRA